MKSGIALPVTHCSGACAFLYPSGTTLARSLSILLSSLDMEPSKDEGQQAGHKLRKYPLNLLTRFRSTPTD